MIRPFWKRLAAAAVTMTLAAPAALAQSDLGDPVAALFPPEMVGPAPDGGWMFDTYRQPVMKETLDGVSLGMTYNGIDDEDWPYTRVLQVMLDDLCGTTAPGTAEDLINRTYEQPSTAPQENLGGNAGMTFDVSLSEAVGSCQVAVRIEGARWHSILTTIDP